MRVPGSRVLMLLLEIQVARGMALVMVTQASVNLHPLLSSEMAWTFHVRRDMVSLKADSHIEYAKLATAPILSNPEFANDCDSSTGYANDGADNGAIETVDDSPSTSSSVKWYALLTNQNIFSFPKSLTCMIVLHHMRIQPLTHSTPRRAFVRSFAWKTSSCLSLSKLAASGASTMHSE
jgi:hypothetical protein